MSMLKRDNSYQRLNGSMAEMEQRSIRIKLNHADSQDNGEASNEVRILFVNLTYLPRYVQLIACTGAVFFFYLIYGYFQVGDI